MGLFGGFMRAWHLDEIKKGGSLPNIWQVETAEDAPPDDQQGIPNTLK